MSFNAESTHPYIVNSRIKAASGTGGIGNIPIASSDTIGGVKIGDGVNISEDGTISVASYTSQAYSTEEHKTGRKWKDGKDIYEISFIPAITSLSSGTNVTIANGVNYVEKLVSSNATITSQDGSGVDCNVAWVDVSNNLKVKPSAGWTNITELVVTIQYTKTT